MSIPGDKNPSNILMAQAFLQLENDQLKSELRGFGDTLRLALWSFISSLAADQIAKLRAKIDAKIESS